MPRPEKVRAIAEIKDHFAGSSASFLTEYRGLKVPHQQELRRALGEAGARYKVWKMTLTRRAWHELGPGDIEECVAGPTAGAFDKADPVPDAKTLIDFSKENEGLVVKAGLLQHQVVGPDQIRAIAAIEGRDALLAKIAGAMKGPLSKAAFLLGSFTRETASVLSQLIEKKEAAKGGSDSG